MGGVLNRRGDVFLQAVISLSIILLGIVAMMEVLNQSNRTAQSNLANQDFSLRLSNVSLVMGTTTSCSGQLHGIPFNMTAGTLNNVTVNMPTTGAPLISPNLDLPSYKVTQSAATVVSGDLGAGRYLASLKVQATKKEGKYLGAQVLNREIPFYVTFYSNGGVNSIDTCTSSVSGGTPSGVPPTNCHLSQAAGHRDLTVSWTAGSGNGGAGGCKLQYFKNNTTWTDVPGSSENCDANAVNLARNLPPDGSGWNGSWSGASIPMRLANNLGSVCDFIEPITCTVVAMPTSATPNIDEDCNGVWNNELPPSNLVLTHTPNNQVFTFSWTGGSGNGGAAGCHLERQVIATTQVTILNGMTQGPTSAGWLRLNNGGGDYNCDQTLSTVSQIEVEIRGLEYGSDLYVTDGAWSNAGHSPMSVRIVRNSDNAVIGTFPQQLTCNPGSGAVNPTTNFDEDCNGIWNEFRWGGMSCGGGHVGSLSSFGAGYAMSPTTSCMGSTLRLRRIFWDSLTGTTYTTGDCSGGGTPWTSTYDGAVTDSVNYTDITSGTVPTPIVAGYFAGTNPSVGGCQVVAGGGSSVIYDHPGSYAGYTLYYESTPYY